MQTHGYEHSAPWRQALALLDHLRALTADFKDDPFGCGGKLRAMAADLPIRCAVCFEESDYESVQSHASAIIEHLFKLLLQAQVAGHLGLLTGRQLKVLRKKLDSLENAVTALPDELFEDDGQDELKPAA